MNQDEGRKLDNMLISMGLSGLEDPALMQRLAQLISEWPGDKDQFFQDLLGECDATKRAEMYNAMAPRLTFKPRSIIEYETSIQMRANEMISHGRMRVEGRSPRPINVGNQNDKLQASATLCCYHCKRRSKFCEETPVGAIIKARKAGWVRTAGFDIETCPKCAKKGKAMTQRQALQVAGNA